MGDRKSNTDSNRSKSKRSTKGGANESLLTSVYVDEFIMVIVQRNASDQTALIAPVSLASHNVILLLGQVERAKPLFSPPERALIGIQQ